VSVLPGAGDGHHVRLRHGPFVEHPDLDHLLMHFLPCEWERPLQPARSKMLREAGETAGDEGELVGSARLQAGTAREVGGFRGPRMAEDANDDGERFFAVDDARFDVRRVFALPHHFGARSHRTFANRPHECGLQSSKHRGRHASPHRFERDDQLQTAVHAAPLHPIGRNFEQGGARLALRPPHQLREGDGHTTLVTESRPKVTRQPRGAST
jgi:hypothetical protein